VSRYFPLARGYFIASPFGPRDGGFHAGTDFGWLGGSGGLPIYACQAGTVLYAGAASGYGGPDPRGWVVIDSTDAEGGGCAEYGHLVREVGVGEQVQAGQRIAHINPDSGSNGGVPPHCHLSIMPRGYDPATKIDPIPWLGAAAYAAETPTPAGAPVTIFGPDIANFQAGMDLAQVKAEGFDFVFCKVSEGNYFQDQTWPGFRDAARANGLLLAGYHYVRGDNTPDSQADTFVQQLGDKSIPAMLDFEANGGNIDNFWAVLNAIQARGVHVALSYIPHWYWQQIGSPDISTVPGLIQSSYVGGSGFASALYPGDQAGNWAGFGGRSVDILQFTDKASIAGHAVDCNAFCGTRDQLAALLGGTNPTQGVDVTPDECRQAIRDVLNEQAPTRVPGSTVTLGLGDCIRNADAAAFIAQHALTDPIPSAVPGSTYSAPPAAYWANADSYGYQLAQQVPQLVAAVQALEAKFSGGGSTTIPAGDVAAELRAVLAALTLTAKVA